MSISANATNLIGNPYPSAIDADAFYNAAALEGTLYFGPQNRYKLASQIDPTGTAGSGTYDILLYLTGVMA
jgi:hypothetical protein